MLLVLFLDGDPLALLGETDMNLTSHTVPYSETAEEREMMSFVSVVLADKEEVWADIFDKEAASKR